MNILRKSSRTGLSLSPSCCFFRDRIQPTDRVTAKSSTSILRCPLFGSKIGKVPGFSLVEVILALAILSFTMVGFAGFVPLALGTLRQTIDMNVESQIIQSLISESQSLDFSQITATSAYGKSFPRTYDDQGQLSTSNTTGTFVPSYQVSLSIAPCQVPGATSSSPSAQALRITCTNLHKKGAQFTYSIWVVNNGR